MAFSVEINFIFEFIKINFYRNSKQIYLGYFSSKIPTFRNAGEYLANSAAKSKSI